MGIAAITSLLFLVAALSAIHRSVPREGYFSTVTFFAVGCAVYYVAIPLEMLLRGSESIQGTEIPIRLSPGQAGLVIVMAAIAVAAFSIGYGLSGFTPFAKQGASQQRDVVVPKSLVALTTISLTAGVGLLALVPGAYARVSSYSEIYQLISQNPIVPVIFIGIYVPVSIIAGVLVVRRGPGGSMWAVPLVMFLIAFSLVVKRKEALTMALLALVVPYAGIRRPSRWHLAGIVAAVALTFVGFQAYSAYRGGAELSRAGLFGQESGIAASSDAGGPFAALSQTIGQPEKLHLGSTYLEAVTLLLPRAVWPTRPLDLASRFARDNLPSWNGGLSGSGYSLMAEANANFGPVGSAVQYFALGWSWGMAWKWVRRRLRRFGFHSWRSTYIVVGFFLLLTMHRAPVAVLAKGFLLLLGPLMLMSAWIDSPAVRREPQTNAGGGPMPPTSVPGTRSR